MGKDSHFSGSIRCVWTPFKPTLWGGFVNGVLHVPSEDDEARATPEVAIFTSEADARRFYDDVRPIQVSEVKQ